MKIFAITLATSLLGAIAAGPALAQPEVNLVTRYYDVSGKSARALRSQMKSLGPDGYWADTHWRVNWSSSCEVDVTITYYFPRLVGRAGVPLPLRRRWDKMMAALTAHERGHAEHGLHAAREVEDQNCRNAPEITAKWSRADKTYDRTTRHGKTQGVHLAY